MAACGFAGGLVDEIGADAAGYFRPAADMVAGENVLRPKTLGRGIEQDPMQRAAVNRELRPFVTRLQPARLAPDRLAVLEKISELLGAPAGGVEPVVQP